MLAPWGHPTKDDLPSPSPDRSPHPFATGDISMCILHFFPFASHLYFWLFISKINNFTTEWQSKMMKSWIVYKGFCESYIFTKMLSSKNYLPNVSCPPHCSQGNFSVFGYKCIYSRLSDNLSLENVAKWSPMMCLKVSNLGRNNHDHNHNTG